MQHAALIADIGATTTRTALVGANGAYESVVSVSNMEAGDLSDYLAHTLERASPRPLRAVLAVAAPVDGEEIVLTNHPWSFARKPLSEKLGLRELTVVNDFAAAAYAIPRLRESDTMQIGAGEAVPGATQLILGPGTGFGVAAVHYADGKASVIPSEAGHMRFGATTPEEAAVLDSLSRDLGSVTVEHILSGEGIARLHRVLHGKDARSKQIIADAAEGLDEERQTISVFLRIFGRIVGDFALAFDARGGIFLAGGVVRSLAPLIAESPFFANYREHPPYEGRLDAIPLHLVLHSMPGLLGAASIAQGASLTPQ